MSFNSIGNVRSLPDVKCTEARGVDYINIEHAKTKNADHMISIYFVGVPGFEPGTPWSQTRCATGLRYTPNNL